MCHSTHEQTTLINKRYNKGNEGDIIPNDVLCQHCDLFIRLPPLSVGQKACCPRCNTTVYRRFANPALLPVCYAYSALIMFALAFVFPFVYFTISGNFSQIYLYDIPPALFMDNYAFLSLLFIVFIQIIPIITLFSIIVLCQAYFVSNSIRRLLARLLYILKPWSMVEIFLTGVMVSFVKLISYGGVGINLSFIAYAIFCLLQLKALNTLDRRWLWQHIGTAPLIKQSLQLGKTGASQGVRLCFGCFAILPQEESICPRCHTRGQLRRANSLQMTYALILTSMLLYLPANILPIMLTVAIGHEYNSTIISGVISMWNEGSYPVAIIIFLASILIPCLKIIAITYLCLYAKGVGNTSKITMHRLYSIVEFVGRWSMIDIFVIAVLSALVRVGNLMGVFPNDGAIYFALVVIFTMVASKLFDPRLIWDRVNVSIKKEITRARAS